MNVTTTTIPTAAELRERKPDQTLAQQCDEIRQAMSDRIDAAETILEDAGVAGRENLLASEQREHDGHHDELRRLGTLLRRLENSPEAQSVDYGQILSAGLTQRDDRGPLLRPEQRVADFVARRGGVHPEHAQLRLGAILRGWVTGRWDGADAELRAMSEGVSTAGGILVPTPLSANLIDRARNMSRCFQAGATTVPMEAQTLKVPRLTGSSAPAWRNENAAVAEGDLTLDSVTLTAKSLAFLVKMSRELVEDAEPEILGVVERDLAAQVALEFDRVMLRGTGTAPEPRGVRNTTGVTVTAFGGANGAAPTNYDHLLDAVQVVRGNNFEPNAVIQSPRSETTLAKLKEATTNAYLQPPAQLADLPRLTTNQIPGNLTTGTSTDTTEVYVGEWPLLYFGLRTTPLMFQLVERFADVGQIAVLVWARGDVAVAQPGAFNVVTGVRP